MRALLTVPAVGVSFALGCTRSHAALTAGGANVQAVSAVQAGPVANCQFLGPVQAQFGANFVSQEENLAGRDLPVRSPLTRQTTGGGP